MLKQKENQVLLSDQGRTIFVQQKVDVESVFGRIKTCLRYTRCNLRGKGKVKIDIGLVFMVNNLKKYNKRMIKTKK